MINKRKKHWGLLLHVETYKLHIATMAMMCMYVMCQSNQHVFINESMSLRANLDNLLGYAK